MSKCPSSNQLTDTYVMTSSLTYILHRSTGDVSVTSPSGRHDVTHDVTQLGWLQGMMGARHV